MKYIIVIGNLNEGFAAYGTYDSFDEAYDACEGAESVSVLSLGTPEEAEVYL